jgi:hypothetical protein
MKLLVQWKVDYFLVSKLINYTGHKKELLEEWKEYLNSSIYKNGNKTVLIMKNIPVTNHIPIFFSILSMLTYHFHWVNSYRKPKFLRTATIQSESLGSSSDQQVHLKFPLIRTIQRTVTNNYNNVYFTWRTVYSKYITLCSLCHPSTVNQ